MKKLLLFPMLAFLFVAFISCEKDQLEPVINIDDQQVTTTAITPRSNAEVPFKATLYNTINSEYTFFDDEGNLHEEINGIGKGTHLGKCTWYSLTTVYTSAPLPPVPPEPPFTFNQDGTMTFTAADGSTLVGGYAGTTTGPGVEYYFQGGGEWWIDYGTKRFVGTTGGGGYSYVAMQDPVTLAVTSELEFTGTLTNP